MPVDENGPLVSTQWLAENLDDPDLRVVDVRWQSRYANSKGTSFDDRDGYAQGHIPGAVFAGMVGDLSDPDHPIPDMLAGPERFADVMGRLGIGDDTLVVAYDNMGLPLGSARLWWALSYYGHERARVLDGGLRQWQAERRPLSREEPSVEPATFTAIPQPGWVADKQDVLAALDDPDTVIVDCLAQEQYQGKGCSGIWGARAGHIPGAVNVPSIANIDPSLAAVTAEERSKQLEERGFYAFSAKGVLAELYENAGVMPGRKVITYCGRGFAAACGLLALKVLGYDKVRLYDASWAEWGNDLDLPVER